VLVIDSSLFCPAVLLILRNMLSEPNVDSPLEEEVAEQFRNNRANFNKIAKEWTKKHAVKM
jgi:ubiquitin-protein ligase